MADTFDDVLGSDDAHRFRLHFCVGQHCTARGCRSLLPGLHRALGEAGLSDAVEVLETTCRNRCDYGPSMNVYPGPVWYNELDGQAINRIVREHLVGGEIVEEYTMASAMQREQERKARKAALRKSRGG